MKAIIHIGMKKTGSTSIQSWISLNRTALWEEGFRFIEETTNPAALRNAACHVALHEYGEDEKTVWPGRWKSQRNDSDYIVLSEKLEALSNKLGIFVYSHEGLFDCTKLHMHALDRFLARYFDDRKYIVYIRDTVDFFVSMYSQKIVNFNKKYGAIPFSETIERCARETIPFAEDSDFGNLFIWGEVFGKRLSVRLLESGWLFKGDLISDFASLLGVGVNRVPDRMNESLATEYIEYGRDLLIKYSHGFHTDFRKTVMDILLEASSGKPKLSASDEQAESIYELRREEEEKIRLRFFPDRARLFSQKCRSGGSAPHPLTPCRKEEIESEILKKMDKLPWKHRELAADVERTDMRHFQTDDLKDARSMALKIQAQLENGFLNPEKLSGDVPVAVTALLGWDRKRLAAICASAGPKNTLQAIQKTRNLDFSGMENLWDTAMEAFPRDAELATLCTEMNILVSRHTGKARAELFESWLKLADDTADLRKTYKFFRVCHEFKFSGRRPIVALRDAMDRATAKGMSGTKRVAEAITACNFADLALVEKIIAGLPSNEPGLAQAQERLASLREALGWLADEVQDAIERFWKTTAIASNPPAAARADLREYSDAVAILMPFGQALYGKKVTVNQISLPVPRPMNIIRIIKATIGILQERGQKYRIYMWPWPGKTFPLPRHVRTLSFHAIASEAVSRTVLCKRSHIPDKWLISRSDNSGFPILRHLTRGDISKLDDAPHEREAFFRTLQEKYIDANLSTKDQPKLHDTMLPDDYVFLAMQSLSDNVQAFAWIDRLTLISETIRWAERTGRPLVIKRHPLCRNIHVTRILDRKLPPSVHVVNGSIHHLIKSARAVIVANSSVGFEALMHGKLVIAVAPSDYQVATRTAHTVDDFHKLLDRIDSLSDDTDFVKTFVHVYLKKLVVDPKDDKAIEFALSRQFELAGWWEG